jgi:hypothetical protein
MKRYNNIFFVHFDKELITEEFSEYAKSQNLPIMYKCCNGKGVGILNRFYINLQFVVENFITNQTLKNNSAT